MKFLTSSRCISLDPPGYCTRILIRSRIWLFLCIFSFALDSDHPGESIVQSKFTRTDYRFDWNHEFDRLEVWLMFYWLGFWQRHWQIGVSMGECQHFCSMGSHSVNSLQCYPLVNQQLLLFISKSPTHTYVYIYIYICVCVCVCHVQ